jgi:glycosyltransferase involved in cell wall biosynthesis
MNSNITINLFLLPAVNRNNKYIDLLSSSISKAGPMVNVIGLKDDRLFNIIPFLTSGKTKGVKNIIHIQWSTLLYGSRFFIKSILSLVFNVLLIILIKAFFRFKVVWTIHNFFAHDYPHHLVDYIGRRILLAISDCVVVQQKSTLSDYQARSPWKDIQYIPHGNFIDAYGSVVERDYVWRRSLGFKDDDIVLLSFGAIAPYKLNEKIIEAVVEVGKEIPNIKLLIVGKGNEQYVRLLTNTGLDCSNIVVQNRFVPDNELSRYLSIADYSIFYYDQSEMTSGSMILSLSYGVPVISRHLPATEVVTDKNGLVFSDYDELVGILKKIKQRPAQYNSYAIIDDMRSFGWSDSAKKLVNIYHNL